MRRVIMLASLVLSLASCGGSPEKYAAAAVTLGAGVGLAGANRAATRDCWASCPMGTACDEDSGTCIPLPCRGTCPADSRCELVEGKETCVRGRPRDVPTGPPEPLEASQAPEPQRAPEPQKAPGPQKTPGPQTTPEPLQMLKPPMPPPAPPSGATDPCSGLCLKGERCEVREGVGDCVPEKPPATQK